jgi:hypothetical protein
MSAVSKSVPPSSMLLSLPPSQICPLISHTHSSIPSKALSPTSPPYRGLQLDPSDLTQTRICELTIQEICKRWYPSITNRQKTQRTGESAHRSAPVPLSIPAPIPVHSPSLTLSSPYSRPMIRKRVELMPRALDDIKASISELKFYRDNIFIPQEARETRDPKGESSESTSGSGSGTTTAPQVRAQSTEERVVEQIRKTAL